MLKFKVLQVLIIKILYLQRKQTWQKYSIHYNNKRIKKTKKYAKETKKFQLNCNHQLFIIFLTYDWDSRTIIVQDRNNKMDGNWWLRCTSHLCNYHINAKMWINCRQMVSKDLQNCSYHSRMHNDIHTTSSFCVRYLRCNLSLLDLRLSIWVLFVIPKKYSKSDTKSLITLSINLPIFYLTT